MLPSRPLFRVLTNDEGGRSSRAGMVNGLLTRRTDYGFFSRPMEPAMRSTLGCLVLALAALACRSPAAAQDKGTVDAKALPPLADPGDPRLPAKEAFGRALTPIEVQAPSIGSYARGCPAGAKALTVDRASLQRKLLSPTPSIAQPAMI